MKFNELINLSKELRKELEDEGRLEEDKLEEMPSEDEPLQSTDKEADSSVAHSVEWVTSLKAAEIHRHLVKFYQFKRSCSRDQKKHLL